MSINQLSNSKQVLGHKIKSLAKASASGLITNHPNTSIWNSASAHQEVPLRISAKQAQGLARSLAQTSSQLQLALNKVMVLKEMTRRIAELADLAQKSFAGTVTKQTLRLEAAGIQKAYQGMVSSVTVGGNPRVGADQQSGGVAFLNNVAGTAVDRQKTFSRKLTGVETTGGAFNGKVTTTNQKYKFKLTGKQTQKFSLTLNKSGQKLTMTFRNMNIAANGWMGSTLYAKTALTSLGTSYARYNANQPTTGGLTQTYNSAVDLSETAVGNAVDTKATTKFIGAAGWGTGLKQKISAAGAFVNVSASAKVEKIYTNGTLELQRSIQLLATSLFCFDKAEEMNHLDIESLDNQINDLTAVDQALAASELGNFMTQQNLNGNLTNVLLRSVSLEQSSVISHLQSI